MRSSLIEYRTTDRVANLVNRVVDRWPSPNCTGAAPSSELITNSPLTDGAWHQLSGTLMAPPGTGSANFALGEAVGSAARHFSPRISTTSSSTSHFEKDTEHPPGRDS